MSLDLQDSHNFPIVRMVPTGSTFKPEPEPGLNADQFYAINGHIFKDFRIGDDMMLSRKETVVITVGGNHINVHRELLVGCHAFHVAFTHNMLENKNKEYIVQYELENETNSQFELQAHIILFLALYGATKLPEDQYNFRGSAGPILVRAVALAEYRMAEDYVNDRLNTMITKHFNRMVDWKTTIPCMDNSLQLELHRGYLMEINDTFIAYKCSNIRDRRFPERAFGNLIALHCPARAWEMFQSQVDEDLARRVATAAMYMFGRLHISGEVFERTTFSNADLSLFRFPQ
ncbi:hypothetical protein PG997_005616 [Apiospora hydei]|uniref:BTB domain-containing protein n=1 Tax=Apiospora hydei TaxID=1337664 RepID=A0ABR1WLF3_9PEZI